MPEVSTVLPDSLFDTRALSGARDGALAGRYNPRMRRWIMAAALVLGACGGESEASERTRERPSRSPEQVERIAGGVSWTDPSEPLVYRAPENAMRAAEYEVRGHEGATLGVFYFGNDPGGGGTVQSNIDRWLAQLTQPDGRPTSEVAQIDRRTTHDLPVTIVDARGTFDGRLGMGGDAPPRPGWRVLGAIVEGPEGLVFFKLTGPEAAVRAAEESFEELVGSIHP